MIRLGVLLASVLMAGSAVAAETGPVTEGFACSLRSGKTLDDFDKATAYWSTQMDKIPGGRDVFVTVLKPLRGGGPTDVYWLGTYPNLNVWAKDQAAYEASTEGRAAEASFDKVVTCQSGLWFAQPVYEGLPAAKPDDTSVVEEYRCNLNDGKTMANVEHVHALWKSYIDQAKTTDPALARFSAYVLAPWFADSPYDLTYLIVDDSLADFAKINTAAMTQSPWRPVQAAFDDTMTCDASLLSGKIVRVPPAVKNTAQ
jgi:hypothetical protein